MIFQHTCPICGTHLDAEEEIARLRARVAALEAVPPVASTQTPANDRTRPRPLQRAKTITANGVTITPKWKWSKDYEQHARAAYRGVHEPRGNDLEHKKGRAVQYARWLGERRGLLSIGAEYDGRAAFDCSAVVFRDCKFSRPDVRVEIPNHDWVDPYAGTYEYQSLRQPDESGYGFADEHMQLAAE